MISRVDLIKVLDYNRNTGLFFWKISPNGMVKASSIAGTKTSDGYIEIKINKKSVGAHRLAWIYEYNEDPPEQIDHINHNKCDNRISNLRLVSCSDNQKNVKMRVDNSSGFTGIYWVKPMRGRKGYWKAQLNSKGKTIYLGGFSNKDDAINARKKANKMHGFHENHGKKD